MKKFDNFLNAINTFGENEFGAIENGRNTDFWKINCLDLDPASHSLDPSDPHVTRYVLTIKLGEGYLI